MKFHLPLLALASAALSGCLAAPAAAHGIDIHKAMHALGTHYEVLEQNLLAGTLEPSLAARAREMARISRELAAARAPYGPDDFWSRSLTESAIAADRIAAALELEVPDLKASLAALKDLSAVRERAHDRYRPGLMAKLRRWLLGDKRHPREEKSR